MPVVRKCALCKKGIMTGTYGLIQHYKKCKIKLFFKKYIDFKNNIYL